jgi:hypothetical protein
MYRLIYKSRSVDTIDWDSMRDILNVSERNNATNDLTGVLLASNTHFLQAIEGRFEELNLTFNRIMRDARHTDLMIISYGPIDARLFEHWGMKGIGVFDFNVETSDKLKTKYGEEEGGVKFPLEEWLALSLFSDIEMIGSLPDWKK